MIYIDVRIRRRGRSVHRQIKTRGKTSPMEVRQNLVKLCEKINDGHYKITPDCAEYRAFEKWMTDEQINLLMNVKGTMKINRKYY
mgnify:FL=1